MFVWIDDIADVNKLKIYRGEHKGINGIAVFDLDKQNRPFLEKRWAENGSVFTYKKSSKVRLTLYKHKGIHFE